MPSFKDDDIHYIQDFHPLVDEDWRERIEHIFEPFDVEYRVKIAQKYLYSKGVIYDQYQNTLSLNRVTLKSLRTRAEDPAILTLIAKTEELLKELKHLKDISLFSTKAEIHLQLLSDFKAAEKLSDINQLIDLKFIFIRMLIVVIKRVEFERPKTVRQLQVAELKSFLINVFIKYELLTYRFRTLDPKELAQDPRPFIHKIIYQEATQRQCDIIKTEDYIFLIGPNDDIFKKRLSITRFIEEDIVAQGKKMYFNGAVVYLNSNQTSEELKKTRSYISRIFTLEKKINHELLDALKEIELSREKNLLPLLNKPISTSDDEDNLIKKRFIDFERSLVLLILRKSTNALEKMAKTQDDCQMVFTFLKRLSIKIAFDLQEFNLKTLLKYTHYVDKLDIKIISYLSLLDKIKEDAFTVHYDEKKEPILSSNMLANELKLVVKTAKAQIDQDVGKLEKAVENINNGYNMLQKLNILSKPSLPDIENSLENDKRKYLASIMGLMKKYPKTVSCLELEGLMSSNNLNRHYTISSGTRGISMLPRIIELYEDWNQFDPIKIKRSIDVDIMKLAQDWDDNDHYDEAS